MTATEVILLILVMAFAALFAIAYTLFLRYRRRLKHGQGNLPEFWRGDPEFVAARKDAETRTEMIVDPSRCYTLFQLSRAYAEKPGAMAEVGVYKGGTARILAAGAPGAELHLFDTFEGMPRFDPKVDHHRLGEFADTSLQNVRRVLDGCDNVHFHQGIFPDTAAPIENTRFRLVHLDVDNYESNRDALAFFYDRMETGGAIVFDDYQWKHTPGIEQSIREFLEHRPEHIVRSGPYQAVLFKV